MAVNYEQSVNKLFNVIKSNYEQSVNKFIGKIKSECFHSLYLCNLFNNSRRTCAIIFSFFIKRYKGRFYLNISTIKHTINF